MPSNYQGDDSSYPEDVPILDDGDPANAAFFNPPHQRLADRAAYLLARITGRVATFTAAGTFTPAHDGWYLLDGWGAGGNGAPGGVPLANTTDDWSGGGGGGAGAKRLQRWVYLTGGVTYAITIGLAGAHPVAGSGADGGDTTFVGVGVSVTMPGGGGGQTATGSSVPEIIAIGRGGLWPRRPTKVTAGAGDQQAWYPFVPGQGGSGISKQVGDSARQPGAPSEDGFAGGVTGTFGASDGSHAGGGAGGGGGAGPEGAGGAGGTGGVGENSGAAGNGTAGTSAPVANSGAGGGGGGGGGTGSASNGTGGDGGAGADDKLYVRWIGKAATIT